MIILGGSTVHRSGTAIFMQCTLCKGLGYMRHESTPDQVRHFMMHFELAHDKCQRELDQETGCPCLTHKTG